MLGLCCQYMVPHTKRNGTVEYVNDVNESNLQYGQFQKGKYSEDQIDTVWFENCVNLLAALKKVHADGIKCFRVSSNLFPLYDSVPELLHKSPGVKQGLYSIGKFIKDNNMRMTTHPDQFVVISSNREEVITKSLSMLDHFAWIFDEMELDVSPFYAINIHGGTKGNIKILNESIKKMSESAKGRLTLENDESSYNVVDLYSTYEETGVPICWDSHHHTFNDAGLSLEDGMSLAKKTWGNVKQLTHLSNTEPSLVNGNFKDRRKHSDYVHYIPDVQLKAHNNNEIDIEMEFKMKNLAILKAVKDFDIKLV